MATRVSQRVSPFERRLRRIVQDIQAIVASGELVALLLVLLILLMPVLALDAADWPLAMGTLLPVVFLSAIFGFLRCRGAAGRGNVCYR